MSTRIPDAYLYQHNNHYSIQLVSLAARSIHELTPDHNGLITVCVGLEDDETETGGLYEVFRVLDEAGLCLRTMV